MKPGQGDHAHDHAPHYMYIKKGGKLAIAHDGKTDEMEMPTGVGVALPAGPHQVTNIGDDDVEVLFVEVTGELGETPEGHTSPFDTNPEHYKVLVEDEEWFVGQMSMTAGEEDAAHSHRDHFIYVLEGDGITLYPGKEKGEEKMEVPIKPGMSIPVKAGWHVVVNS